MRKLVNEHAECLREQADEIESLDTVEMAIVGATMRNAANEIDRQADELSKLRALADDFCKADGSAKSISELAKRARALRGERP